MRVSSDGGNTMTKAVTGIVVVGNSARKRRDSYCSIVLRTVKKRKRWKEERENQVTRREAKHYEITLGEVETGQARSTLCPLRHHFSNSSP